MLIALTCISFTINHLFLGCLMFYNVHIKYKTNVLLFNLILFPRDAIGAELFLLSDQARNSNELCVLVGNQLCLHLCIQTRNISPVYRGRICKIHCILAVKSPRPLPEGRKNSEVLTGFQQWKIEETIDTYELLMLHMRNGAKKRQNMRAVPTAEVDLVTAYVCVEPNSLGQGFSTCSLDVSGFPEGVYQIKWHSCCVDKNDCLWSLPAFNNGIPFSVTSSFAT